MAPIARNAPCPCGSARKYKLCCGTTREQERAARRALGDLLELPAAFPLLRPDSADFEDWLTVHRDEQPTRVLVEEGVTCLCESERERISCSYGRSFPRVWENLCADVGGEEIAASTVLVGAVLAALAEERLPGGLELSLVEDDAPADPAETLALCLCATDLWSVVEAVAADGAVAAIPEELDEDEYETEWDAVLDRETTRLLTRRHRRRLWLLVRRLRGEVPIAGSPRASEAIARACAAFERDRHVRARLAALLLADTLGPVRLISLRLLLAA